jgi:hypothetical protein
MNVIKRFLVPLAAVESYSQSTTSEDTDLIAIDKLPDNLNKEEEPTVPVPTVGTYSLFKYLTSSAVALSKGKIYFAIPAGHESEDGTNYLNYIFFPLNGSSADIKENKVPLS